MPANSRRDSPSAFYLRCPSCGCASLTNRPRLKSPIPHVLGSNTAADVSDVAAVHAFIEQVDAQLKALDVELSRLYNVGASLECEENRLKQLKAKHKRAISRIHTLPPEIVSEVFIFAVHSDGWRGRTDAYSAPFVVAAVSQRWRQIAIATSRIWSETRLRLATHHMVEHSDVVAYQSHWHNTETRLQRSSPAPCSLYLSNSGDAESPGWEPFRSVVLLHSYRMYSADLTIPAEVLQSGMFWDLPVLQELTISIESRGDDIDMPLPFEMFAHASSLTTLTTDSITASMLVLPWAQLRSLDMRCVYYHSDINPETMPHELDNPLRLMVLSPHLESLIIRGSIPPLDILAVSSPHVIPTHSSCLRALQVDDSRQYYVLLSYLTLPGLQELALKWSTFNGAFPEQPLLDFLTRSRCPLRKFSMQGSPMPSFFQHMPHLEELTIEVIAIFGNWDSRVLDVLSISDGVQPVCVKLHTFGLNCLGSEMPSIMAMARSRCGRAAPAMLQTLKLNLYDYRFLADDLVHLDALRQGGVSLSVTTEFSTYALEGF